mgnify:CR=1 FL=1
MRVEVNKFGGIEVYTDLKDNCYACGNLTDCPLIQALQSEVVVLHYAEIDVLRCGLYKRKDTECLKSR